MNKTELESKIKEAARLYYTDGNSPYTNEEYDQMLEALKVLDPHHELISSLGEDHTAGFQKVIHPVPMLSLEKVQQTREEGVAAFGDVRAWLQSKIAQVMEGAYQYFVIEPKVDGVSCELLYKDCALYSASTRGNGAEGDDITSNLLAYCQNIPLTLKNYSMFMGVGDVLVRGEIYMSREEFLRINTAQRESGAEEFANARNLCAGTIKSKEPVAGRRLNFVVHGFRTTKESRLTTTSINHLYSALAQEGFDVVPGRTVDAKYCHQYENSSQLEDMVIDAVKHFNEFRPSYPYEIDGAVIKVGDLATSALMGATSHHPKGAVAVKFLPENKVTKVRNIVWQVSRNGKLVPVAEFEPIWLAGSEVKRATLNNAGKMAAMGIKAGSTIHVEKANDIIPRIVSVDSPEPYALSPFRKCPSCGKDCTLVLGASENTSDYVCGNPECPEKLASSLYQALGANGLNALGIGMEYCRAFVSMHGHADIIRILRLRQDQYPSILSPVQKANVYTAMQVAIKAPLHRWIAALQFPGVGMGTAKKIAQRCSNFTSFAEMIEDKQHEALGITQKQAEAIRESFNKNAWEANLASLLGINPASDCFVEASGYKPLGGLNFVVSGVFHTGRKNVEMQVPMHGGVLKSGVSKKVDYLVAGEDAGPSKLEKAAKLGIKVISEDEFLQMISPRDN